MPINSNNTMVIAATVCTPLRCNQLTTGSSMTYNTEAITMGNITVLSNHTIKMMGNAITRNTRPALISDRSTILIIFLAP